MHRHARLTETHWRKSGKRSPSELCADPIKFNETYKTNIQKLMRCLYCLMIIAVLNEESADFSSFASEGAWTLRRFSGFTMPRSLPRER